MELTDAREMFDATVNAVLQDTAIGAGSGSVYEAVDRYIRDVNPDVFTLLVDAIKTLQAAGAVILGVAFGREVITGGLDDVVRRYVRCLLDQEAISALRLSMSQDGTIKMGQ